jgi:hypothetical protein
MAAQKYLVFLRNTPGKQEPPSEIQAGPLPHKRM